MGLMVSKLRLPRSSGPGACDETPIGKRRAVLLSILKTMPIYTVHYTPHRGDIVFFLFFIFIFLICSHLFELELHPLSLLHATHMYFVLVLTLVAIVCEVDTLPTDSKAHCRM